MQQHKQELATELRQAAHMRQIAEMSQLIETRNEARLLIIDQTISKVVETIDNSKGPFAQMLEGPNNILLRNECVRLIVRHILQQCESRFHDVMNNPQPANSQAEALMNHIHAVNQILSEHQEMMQFIFSGTLPIQRLVHDLALQSEVEQKFASLYEDRKMQQHFNLLLQTGKIGVREVELKDIPLIAALYRESQMTGESLMQMMAGKESSRTFLEDPERDEIPSMERLLPQTKELNMKDRMEDRREKETMEGYVVHGPNDRDDILAVVLFTKSPIDPDKDRDYTDDNTKLIDTLTFADANTKKLVKEKDKFNEYLLGKGGRGVKLVLYLRKREGFGKRNLAEAVKRTKDIVPDTRCFTWTLGGLSLKFNGAQMEDLDIAQNTGCLISLETAKYVNTNVTKFEPERPYKKFSVPFGGTDIILEAKPSDWKYLYAHWDRSLEWAKKIVP